MAARTTKIRHDAETRAKIQASQLINRLQDYIFGRAQLEAGQVTAALGLLRKTLPDLSMVEQQGEVRNYVIRVPAQPADMDAWKKQYATTQPTVQ